MPESTFTLYTPKTGDFVLYRNHIYCVSDITDYKDKKIAILTDEYAEQDAAFLDKLTYISDDLPTR